MPAAESSEAATSAAEAASTRRVWATEAVTAEVVSSPIHAAQALGVGRPVVGRAVAGDLADPADQVGDGALVVLGRAAQLDAPIAQPALDVVEATGLEDLLEQRLPLLGARPEEGLEPALREHRDLAELGQRHPDQPGDEVAGLVEPGAERLPLAAVLAVGVAGAALGDDHPGLLGRGAGAALLGARPGGRAVDAEPPARQRGLEDDARARRRRRRGRSAAAWRPRGRRGRRRRARSRRRRGRWTCRRRSARSAGTGRRRRARRSRRWWSRRTGRTPVTSRWCSLIRPHPCRRTLPRRRRARPGRGRGSSRRPPPGAARSPPWSPWCRARGGRSRGRSRGRWCRTRVGPGPSGRPTDGGNCRTRVCGKRRRSCSIARAGRGTSVSVTCTQSPSRSARVGSLSSSRELAGDPRQPAGDRCVDPAGARRSPWR